MAGSDVFLAGTTGATLVRGIFEPGSQGVQAAWSLGVGLRVDERAGLASARPSRGQARLEEAASSLRTIREVLGRGVCPSDLLGSQPQILFGSASRRPRRGEVGPMTWTTEVPTGAFLTLSDNLHVCSPAFLFVQRADELGLVRAISYGNELCGLYSVDGSERAMNDHPAFATVGDLGRFLAGCRRGRGTKTAREALKWLLPRLRSPKESDTYLLTCLPRVRGGYGMRPRPKANVTIEVPRDLWHLADVPSYEVDLLWEDAMAVVEYDGRDHDDPSQRARDDAKTHVLRKMGYFVTRISWEVLGDAREFDRRMRLLGDRLGVDVPATDREFERARSALRHDLFDCDLR